MHRRQFESPNRFRVPDGRGTPHGAVSAQVRALVVSDEQLQHVDPDGAHTWPSMSVELRLCQTASALLQTLETSCNSRCRPPSPLRVPPTGQHG